MPHNEGSWCCVVFPGRNLIGCCIRLFAMRPSTIRVRGLPKKEEGINRSRHLRNTLLINSDQMKLRLTFFVSSQ